MCQNHDKLLLDLLSLPTTSFAEGAVIDYVHDFCRQRPSLRWSQDAGGNVIVRHGPKCRRPLVLAAHMDHPGCVVECMTGRRSLRARWYGGVKTEYFKNARLRFFSEGRWVRGRVAQVFLEPDDGKGREYRRVQEIAVEVNSPVVPGSVGMWDLPDPQIRGSRVYARGCDDVAGVAAILAAMDVVAREHPARPLCALLTRAEEVGFAGAFAACRCGSIPPGAIVVAIECSSAITGVTMGGGPILRVGDFSTVFTPAATQWCRTVARDLLADEPDFAFQRKLMDGGSCESTVYCEFGCDASGVCIALGNYHNMDTARERIASEYIHLGDWHNMVRWFVAMAATDRKYDGKQADLRKRLSKLENQYRKQLRRTVR